MKLKENTALSLCLGAEAWKIWKCIDIKTSTLWFSFFVSCTCILFSYGHCLDYFSIKNKFVAATLVDMMDLKLR